MTREKRSNGLRTVLEPRRIINEERTWFVVHTLPQAERRAEESLRDEGVDIWLPRYRTMITRRGRRVEADVHFFPGYLFAGLARNERGELPLPTLFDCEHTLDVLGQNQPLALQPTIVQVIADRLTANSKGERIRYAALYEIGQMCQVAQGPFQGFMAEVRELLANGGVRGEVMIFGRRTPVDFDPAMLGAA